MRALDVIDAGPEHAEAVVDIIHRSFRVRPDLDPPSTALEETVESVAEVLGTAGGLLVERRGVPMGALLFDESRPGKLGLRRVAVDPEIQSRGVASAMVGVAEDTAEERGKDGIWLHVREELPDTVRFWTRRKYYPVDQEGPLLVLGKTLWLAREVPTPEVMHHLAARVAELVRPGDLLVLTGDLGAGKTTFTQGLGAALDVRGPITSPTFVLARTHPSQSDGPALVHVDAYRLGGAEEVDDLDLDATAEESVTVVEWGAGMAEQLNDSWLSVSIEVRGARPIDPLGTQHDGDHPDEAEPRVVTIKPNGPRWVDVPLRSTLLG
ncbi:MULTISPECIES: tRNA (adenosine(37)-N6)-threonylcarbamoyltransferase complex ATPase subunit type 1 TsaE [unclassified Aeromicrobium]|jgi:tRNA threonylcarbamoyladenosine biosynthesis protein TsaE|uniref:tRNA (adenosine(37)-N6)-threonylcarbamoyltransferase complex ATPase subunit type 1 TsaE n=1 Tax=unclassified Aeromicrobium TaxID=2633570 RepID=UPI0006FF41E5|nr:MULTISPECIES: tRNA (adenosine(37)-N6)-threonylcarbamoyltransferase complex ATPase subunit type 1 TsaE [unclassified Aeromicrobium]KQO40028.1 tRNA threonylcarbamoyladenosine biosynthesis protein TsaE [Aeromicrobium sp. Leaf245]KQP25831.1 tRNA threonylcarbamoyladenosine biosynthesis protein TsaE [Aeromicrobium sp. Leaf272]RYY45023.1 MAG: tRNA (adenosine(37)-N6)-threonylcarbamoyltransferase complex ATPase subunit type 1 TsaE [Actinomycetales bacterium]